MSVSVYSAAAPRRAFDITQSFQPQTNEHLSSREDLQGEEYVDLTLPYSWGKESHELVNSRCPDPLEKNIPFLLTELSVYEEHRKSSCSTSTASDAILRSDFDEFSPASDPSRRTTTAKVQVGSVRSSSRSELILPDRESVLLPGETGPRDTFATPARYQSLQSQWLPRNSKLDFYPSFLLLEPSTMPGLPLPKPENTPVLAGPADVATERSPSPEVEHPLFTSIRRVLSTNSSFKAEDLIAAIKKRSNPEPPAVDSSPGETSEVPSGQASTSKCGGKRTFSQSGISGSSASNGKRTLACRRGKGAEDGEDDGDGGDRGNSTPRDEPGEPELWACPYSLRYIRITEVREFSSCRRPGFRGRDQLRAHLRNCHSSPATRHAHLPHYYMNDDQFAEVEGVMNNIARPRGRHLSQANNQRWLDVQIAWYRRVWRILFPDSTYEPPSPFHPSNAELKARCHQVVGAMMDVRRQQAQAEDLSSDEGPRNALMTPEQVYEMLEEAIAIALDSAPGYAQTFGDGLLGRAGEGLPRAAAAITTVPPEAGQPGASAPQEEDPAGARVAADLLTPVSSEGETRAETTTPQPVATVLGAPPTCDVRLGKTSDVVLRSDRSISVTVLITPESCSLEDQQKRVARIKVTAPSTFWTGICNPVEIPINDPSQPPIGVEPVNSNMGADLSDLGNNSFEVAQAAEPGNAGCYTHPDNLLFSADQPWQ